MNDIKCSRKHAPQILAIFNEAIATSTALWDYEPRPASSMDAWFDAKERAGYPLSASLTTPTTSSHSEAMVHTGRGRPTIFC